MPVLLPPSQSPGWAPRVDPVSGLGQHTDKVLRDLGPGDDEIVELDVTGTV